MRSYNSCQRRWWLLSALSVVVVVLKIAASWFAAETPVCSKEPVHELKGSDIWDSGIRFEIDHHRKWTCGESCYGPMEGWFQYERSTKLSGKPVEPHATRICEVIYKVYGNESRENVRLMLDHGAGPFTNLGTQFTCPDSSLAKQVDAQVIAVDPLAPLYNGVLNEFKIYRTLRTAYCPSEILTTCIGENVVDFSIIINALDHSVNPLEGFKQALRVTRVGGISCIYSVKNEAEHQGATGFHQWNFDVDIKGHWIIKGTGEYATKQVDVTRSVSHFAKQIDTGLVGSLLGSNPVPSTHMFLCFQKLSSV